MESLSPRSKADCLQCQRSTIVYSRQNLKQARALQENSWDCGVWVLACIASILRGYTSVRLSAKEISEFHRRIAGLIYATSDAATDAN